MKTINTADAEGAVLDWLVAKCEGITKIDQLGTAWVANPDEPHFNKAFRPSTHWNQGGPIIDRERIATLAPPTETFWDARKAGLSIPAIYYRGPSLLIAAMRCFVASKLGDTVEVPEELL